MELAQCEDLLRSQYKKTPQTENFSKLIGDAWWWAKADCYNQMGWLSKIENFLRIAKNTDRQVNENINTTSETTGPIHNSAETTYIAKEESQFSNIIETWTYYAKQTGFFILGLILSVFFLKFLKYLLTFLYDVFNKRRLIYLKVLLPRGEWKMDREQAKELAKDMKEKIWRMGQVYTNLHKLWELSLRDSIMKWIFNKPKIVLLYQYDKGLLNFYIWIYPEYQKIIEWSISAQYATASIETVKTPKIFNKKYSHLMPMQPKKDPVYTIKTYKHIPDDPINNVIDAMAKVPHYDSFSIIIPIKPVGDKFNKRAKTVTAALYKRNKHALNKNKRRKYILMPWKVLEFFISWPSKELISKNADGTQWDKLIRMVKAEEEALNTMGEEAGSLAFDSWILLVSCSDAKERLDDNMNIVVSSYNVYVDQYANSLDNPEKIASALKPIVQPLWKFAAIFRLPSFFYVPNVFTTNELTSLYHFPAATYNRGNIIEWMQYKVLPWPNDLPVFNTFNGYIMSGIVAEKYKWWDLSKILLDYRKHWAIGSKIVKEEKREPANKFTKKQLSDKEIKDVDWKQMVKIEYDKKVVWYKLSKEWVLLWINIYRNNYEPVFMKRNDRTRHHYCIGKSGTWKSVFLETVARQDFWNGDWVCVIDPHGDLVEDLLEYIPKERAKDVIYFDAWNEDRPMWLNLYEINNIDEADRTVNDATEIFIKMFGPEIFGPRIQEYFKFGSLTLLEDFDDRPTILDVPRLFTDDTYREFKTRDIKNPVVRNFREKTFNAMGDREKKEIIPYFTSKFVSFNTNRLIRNIIWQTKSGFNLSDVMDNRKILLISLSKGKIWDMNGQLLWMIIVSKIYNAAMARARMPQEERKDFYLYVDEFQNFVSATFADILSEARKYRLCLIMAHQYIKQLESGKQWEWGKWDVKAAVFGNVWTMQSFKVGAPDAEFLEKEYSPVLSQQDIIGISNYKTYVKLNIDNSTSRPFSMNSIYSSDYKNKRIAPILKEYSAKKYGRKREFIDAEIAAKLGLGIDEIDNLWEETQVQPTPPVQPQQ